MSVMWYVAGLAHFWHFIDRTSSDPVAAPTRPGRDRATGLVAGGPRPATNLL